MLQHTKRQVKLFEMHFFTMFITALCVIFLMKLRWPESKSLYEKCVDLLRHLEQASVAPKIL